MVPQQTFYTHNCRNGRIKNGLCRSFNRRDNGNILHIGPKIVKMFIAVNQAVVIGKTPYFKTKCQANRIALQKLV